MTAVTYTIFLPNAQTVVFLKLLKMPLCIHLKCLIIILLAVSIQIHIHFNYTSIKIFSLGYHASVQSGSYLLSLFNTLFGIFLVFTNPPLIRVVHCVTVIQKSNSVTSLLTPSFYHFIESEMFPYKQANMIFSKVFSVLF